MNNEEKEKCYRCGMEDYKAVMNRYGEAGDYEYVCDDCKDDLTKAE